MRLTVLSQYARGVAQHDDAEGTRLLAELERIKWLIWHGNQHRAKQTIGFFLDDVNGLEVDYPKLRKFARTAHEFAVYIASNAGSLINYGERFRAGERISSCLAESTVNAVISKRFAKRQQMQWTKRGAHLLFQSEPARSMARSGLSSSNGIHGWLTTMPLAMLRQQREYPTYPDALLLWVFSSGSTCRSQNRDVRCQPRRQGAVAGQGTERAGATRQTLAEWSGVIDLAGIEACPLSEWLHRGLREAGNTGRVR